MVDNIDAEISAGLKDAFKNVPVDTTGAEFQNVINDKPIVETTTPVTSTEEKPVVADSSLTNEKSATTTETTPVVSTTTTPVVDAPAKSFEDYLSEKSNGKFKSWEEVEAIANAPKPQLEFKTEQAKHLYELAEKGVEFTPEFFALQTKDFENMTNPATALIESMKLKDYKGVADSTIEFQLRKKYDLDTWAEKKDGVWRTKEGYEMTEEDQANHDLLSRDGENERDWLINYKNERVFAKQPDENQLRQKAESDRQAQENWEKFVDNISNSVSKLSTKIDDKDVVDFEVPETDKKYAADMMKAMTKNVGVFWNQFADDKGNIDQKAVYEAILFLKNKDNIVKVSHQNALAKGKEAEIKTIKNTTFEANPTSPVAKVDWRIKAQEQVEKNL